MAGRFDPVRDSVESSATGEGRRSVSVEASHRKNARSASIADMLNDGGGPRSSAAPSYTPASAHGATYNQRDSSPGYATGHRQPHYESLAREDDARYLPSHEAPPSLQHRDRSSGSISSSGRYHSPPPLHPNANHQQPSSARDIRTERSPSLLHILNSNAHLDDPNRRPSSSSSVHSLGAPYASNNSPDIEYHARMQSQPHAHGSGSPAQRHPIHPANLRGAYQSVRASSSLGSVAEFAVPDLPHRSPESMRGRTSLPQNGSSYSPGFQHNPPQGYHAGGTSSHEHIERDAYGRPLHHGQGLAPPSPGSYPGSQYGPSAPHLPPTMQVRTSAPLHIDTSPYPSHMHQPHSPSQLPQTPYSAAAQSPHRFPPTPGAFATTPGEYMGPPMYHTPRQQSISEIHGLNVPAAGRKSGSRSPLQPGPRAHGYSEEAERYRMAGHGHDGYMAMQEEEARRQEYLQRERAHEEEMARAAERERREWEEREMRAQQERYEMEMMARRREEEMAERRRAEEEERELQKQSQMAAKKEVEQAHSSPPTKKRKGESSSRSAKKSMAKEEYGHDTIKSEDVLNGEKESPPKPSPAVLEKESQEQEQNGEEDAANKEAVARRGKPYRPVHRVSVPTTIKMTLTREMLDRMRHQHRNVLRQNWQNVNPDRSDGWRELIADFEAHQIKPSKKVESSDGNLKRKRNVGKAAAKIEEAQSTTVEVNSKLVAEHYNARRDVGVGQRKNSPIIELRNYNNWVKSLLIQRYGQRRGRALELGGGKGGDLNKWDRLRIKHFVLADIADVSVEQARSRFSERHFSFTADFVAGDCFGEPLANWMPRHILQPMFDNLSLQFCLHYGWENPGRAEQMMENVAKYLRPGGTFIGTMPDCEQLRDRLQSAVDQDRTARSFGNRFYQVTFENVDLDADGRIDLKPFGQKYTFSLLDAVDDVAEYVVDWQHFESLAEQHGLRCVYRKNFQDLWHEEGRPAQSQMRDLAIRMTSRPDSDVPIEPALWEATTVYVAFAFEKRL